MLWSVGCDEQDDDDDDDDGFGDDDAYKGDYGDGDDEGPWFICVFENSEFLVQMAWWEQGTKGIFILAFLSLSSNPHFWDFESHLVDHHVSSHPAALKFRRGEEIQMEWTWDYLNCRNTPILYPSSQFYLFVRLYL